MTTLRLLELSNNKHHEFTQHESDIYTLLVKLAGDTVEFTIECTGEDAVAHYGVKEAGSSISLNQPVPLAKDGSTVSLNLKGQGVHYFHLDMSDAANPLLQVKGEFEDVSSAGTGLEHFFNSKLPVSLEVGRTWMYIDDVLSLGQGSVVELDRLVGEELNVYIGDTLVAKAEVVIAKEQFAARLTTIMPVAREMTKNLTLSTGETL
jgi:flagellar motor switch protein FliN/FliY